MIGGQTGRRPEEARAKKIRPDLSAAVTGVAQWGGSRSC